MRRGGPTRHLIVSVVVLAAFVAAALWGPAPGAAQKAEVKIKIPPLTGELAAGATLYTRYCASCHGATGEGNETGPDKGPPLIHRIYQPNHHGDQAFFVAALIGARQHHWKFGNMRPVEGVGEADVAKIIAFIRALQRENGIE